MRKRYSKIVVTIIASGVLACACSSPPPKPPLKFTGRLLLLAGEDPNNRNLFEAKPGPDSNYLFSSIADGVMEAVAAPDKSRILYASKEGIKLHTLLTGDVKPLVNGLSFCLAWSPDGKRFSYKQSSDNRSKLYVSDLDGKTTMVWEDASGNEAVYKSCAHWVANEKLIFDRLGPSQVKADYVKPNTTTLATVGTSVSLADTERKWSVEGICKDGTAFLRSLDQGQIVIAKNLENPKTAKPAPGPCSSCRFIGFAADSCVPFFLEDSSSSSTVFSLNPANWQRLRGAEIKRTFSPAARMLVHSSARLMVVGDAPKSLFLIDTDSGEIVSMFPDTGPGADLGSPVPVLWIEK